MSGDVSTSAFSHRRWPSLAWSAMAASRSPDADGMTPTFAIAAPQRSTGHTTELAVVVEHRLVLTRLGVHVPVALVETAGVEVLAVDVDLQHLAAAPNDLALGRLE